MALTAQQERFVEEYIKCRKGAEAARRAGYESNSAKVAASRLLTNDNVLNEIKERTKANAMGLDEALSNLANFARADMGQWMSDDGEIDLAAMKRAGATHMLRKVKRTHKQGVSDKGTVWDDVTVEVELHDAKDANKFIADLLTRGPSGKEDDPIHVKHGVQFIREVRPQDDADDEE